MLGAVLAAPADAATPRLELIAPSHHVGLHLFKKKVGLANIGLTVGNRGAPLEIHVARSSFGHRFRAAIFNARTHRRVRRIPQRLLAAANVSPYPGAPPAAYPRLRNFIHVAFHKPGGKIAGAGTIPFCPAGIRERLGGGGPELSRYPYACSSGSPFTRGLVWGIDHDWTAQPLDFGGPNPQVSLRRGPYKAVAKVTKPYRRLFGISQKSATARMRVMVRNGGGGVVEPAGGKQATNASDSQKSMNAPNLQHPPQSARPDPIALAAWNIRADKEAGRDLLTFSATEWNAGPAPLDVEGFRKPGRSRMRAYEYFHNRRGNVIGRKRVGFMEFDHRDGHHHWHLEQFARYSLLSRSGKHLVASHKQSFCIAPTDLIDLTVPGADWMTETTSLFTACGEPTSLWIREILATGWGDTYVQEVAGQAFDISKVPNGRYFVQVKVNPTGELSEGSRSNDSALRRIRLGGTKGHRTVHVAPWRGFNP